MNKYKPVTFIVEGGIGAGKSTLIEKITRELEKMNVACTILKEEYDKQILKEFNDNPKEKGFEFQNYIITQRINQLKETNNNNVQIIIQDRTILSTRIFTKALKK